MWRKSLDAGWLKNHKLWSFWSWCLMKASHQEYDQIINYQTVRLVPGDFIFGLNSASKELRMSIQSIRTILIFLEQKKNLRRKTTNKFSIVSIINWDIYQSEEQTTNKQLTNKQQTTNKQLTTNKHIRTKEHKHIKNNTAIVLPEWLDKELWEKFKKHRKSKKRELTEDSEILNIKKLIKWKEEGYDPKFIIEESIANGWQGLFKPKNKTESEDKYAGIFSKE